MELLVKIIIVLPAPVLENDSSFQNQLIMNSDLIMKSDVLDIIFENRNKEYGAYNLRKYYQARLYQSIGIMLMGVCLLFCLTFIDSNKKNNALTVIESPILAAYHPAMAEVAKPKIAEKKTIKLSVNKPMNKRVQQNGGNKLVYVKDSLKQISDHTITAVVPDVTTTAITTAGGLSTGTADGKSTNTIPAATGIDANTPMASADVYPSYPGGDDALRKFLEKNLRTPEDMPENTSISVQIEFVVGADGKLKGFEIVKDGGEDFDNEVIRVLKKMPNWIPGKSNGHNVSVYHIIPVKFVSEDANP
jgi:periplasmic protein TonB